MASVNASDGVTVRDVASPPVGLCLVGRSLYQPYVANGSNAGSVTASSAVRVTETATVFVQGSVPTCPVGHSFAAAYDVTASSAPLPAMEVGVCASDWGGSAVFGNAGNLSMAQDLHANGVRWVRWDAGNSISNLKTYWLNAYSDYKACLAFVGDTNGSYAAGVAAINATTWANWALDIWQTNSLTKDRVPAIEVLNEPYGSWFWGTGADSQANAEAYGALVKQVYDTFHYALGVNCPKILAYSFGWNGYDDPSGTPNWWTWLTAAHPDIANYHDGVIMHPYGAGTPYGKAVGAAGCRPAVTAAASTTGKPVWITEYGWRDGKQSPNNLANDTTGYQFTDAEVATNIVSFNDWCRSTGYVSATFLYEYLDEPSPAFWGIAYANNPAGTNYVHKPQFAALAAEVAPSVNVVQAVTVSDSAIAALRGAGLRPPGLTRATTVLGRMQLGPSTRLGAGAAQMGAVSVRSQLVRSVPASDAVTVRDTATIRMAIVGRENVVVGDTAAVSLGHVGLSAAGLSRAATTLGQIRLGPSTHLGAAVRKVGAAGIQSQLVRTITASEAVVVRETVAVTVPTVYRLAAEAIRVTDTGIARIRGTRQLGSITVTAIRIYRPAGIQHVRTVGAPTVARRQSQSLVHVRGQGSPRLSARTMPPGIVHARVIQPPRVNTHTLAVASIDRVYA